jgi:adenine deaminase
MKGHLNLLLKKAVSLGLDSMKAVKCVTINPARHYKLESGYLDKEKPADMVEISNLKKFSVTRVFINGKLVSKSGKTLFTARTQPGENSVKAGMKTAADFSVHARGKRQKVRVMGVIDKSLITQNLSAELSVSGGKIRTDLKNDILKICVVERYGHNRISKSFVKGFGLKKGAIAGSVAHDSHNIICVGVDEIAMAKAVNEIIKMRGGLVVTDGKNIVRVELPVAGLMSTEKAEDLSKKIQDLNQFAKKLGCKLRSPFGTLSFMALLVIPDLKISDKGLFDGKNFKFVDVIMK